MKFIQVPQNSIIKIHGILMYFYENNSQKIQNEKNFNLNKDRISIGIFRFVLDSSMAGHRAVTDPNLF